MLRFDQLESVNVEVWPVRVGQCWGLTNSRRSMLRFDQLKSVNVKVWPIRVGQYWGLTNSNSFIKQNISVSHFWWSNSVRIWPIQSGFDQLSQDLTNSVTLGVIPPPCLEPSLLMFNNTKLERARKRRAQSAQPVECQTKLHRTSLEGPTCFIYDKGTPSSKLRQVMTMNLNNRLDEYAQTLSDGKLFARLSGGDAIAQELKYHFACLTDLYSERGCTSEPPRDWNRNVHLKRMCILRASNISTGDHHIW